jgi:hypothetical protein
MNRPSRTEDDLEHPSWNQNPPFLAPDLTTRQDLNGIANARVQRSHSAAGAFGFDEKHPGDIGGAPDFDTDARERPYLAMNGTNGMLRRLTNISGANSSGPHPLPLLLPWRPSRSFSCRCCAPRPEAIPSTINKLTP